MNIPLADFDFSVLEDSEFKEDAVREEVVAPLLKALGWRATGAHRIVRSRPLTHPYYTIGSVKRKVNIIPDYLLCLGDRIVGVIDAKAPGEAIDDPAHVSQAYSYAVHSEVRVDWFGLCNGHELAMYHVADASNEPRLRVELKALDSATWQAVMRILLPDHMNPDHDKYDKDFGIHILRLGISEDTDLLFPNVLIAAIGRTFESEYTISARPREDTVTYCASFDFTRSLYDKLLAYLPSGVTETVSQQLAGHPAGVSFHGYQPEVTILARVNKFSDMIESKREHFVPFTVNGFLPPGPVKIGPVNE